MRSWTWWALIALLVGLAIGCGGKKAGSGKPRVAVSIFPIYDLTKRIAGDRLEVLLVLPPGKSEHGYDPTPKEIARLEGAKLGLAVGLDMDGWVEGIMRTAGGGAKIVRIGDKVPTIPIDVEPISEEEAHEHEKHEGEKHEGEKHDDHDDHDDKAGSAATKPADKAGSAAKPADKHDDHDDHDNHAKAGSAADKHDDHDDHAKAGSAADKHDDHADHAKAGSAAATPADKHDDHDTAKPAGGHAEHDDHDHKLGAPDPHVWLDPHRASTIVDAITAELTAIDPEGKATFEANAKAVKDSIAKTDADIAARSGKWSKRTIVTFHGSMAYYAKRYNIRIAAVVEPIAGKEPTATYIAEVLGAIKRGKAAALFTEPQLDRGPGETIAREAGIPLGELDPVGGVKGRDTYESLLLWNTEQLEKALK